MPQTKKQDKAYGRRKYIRYPIPLKRMAERLHTNYTHLHRVVNGKRKSADLMKRYRAELSVASSEISAA